MTFRNVCPFEPRSGQDDRRGKTQSGVPVCSVSSLYISELLKDSSTDRIQHRPLARRCGLLSLRRRKNTMLLVRTVQRHSIARCERPG
ncbi:Uncharacterized protein DAT39_013016, partial [Clarias magur]